MAQQSPANTAPIGYEDTPMIPGSKWRVHDGTRPHPQIITPGAESSRGEPPSDAIVLFDGSDLSKWTGRDGAAEWKVENGYMEVTRTGNIETKEHFSDCQLHLEWAAPAEVKGDSQGRGNSGVFLMGNYEIQVLDGYDNPTYADGITCGNLWAVSATSQCLPQARRMADIRHLLYSAALWGTETDQPSLHHCRPQRCIGTKPSSGYGSHRTQTGTLL